MINLRSLFASAWMGIQHDLAWTTPSLSLLLRAVAPFASAMTTGIIVWWGITNSHTVTDPSAFAPGMAFVLVGSTMYAHVASYAWVPTIAIAEGKNLAVFPHIYLTARSTAGYVAGRMLSSFVISTFASMLALTIAYFVLGSIIHATIPLIVNPVSVALLAVALVVNIPAAMGLGYLLGAYSLYASKFEWSLPGYVAGLLMVFSGALFPTTILPGLVATGASVLPFTLFIAAVRDAIVFGNLGGYAVSLAECAVGGATLLAIGLWVYLLAERKARKSGVLDRRLA